ncbi:DUF6993 domain-containing protein [Marisediminicola sp. LYQ134]|uniref:DUF6993 domain-containing protein n=1 Tax=unclassified Marisediminicola TaxID=2618316 RepID=UPI003983D9F3
MVRRRVNESGRRAVRGLALTGLIVAATLALAGCSTESLTPEPSASAEPTPSPSAPESAPELVPDGSAADNRAYFDLVNSDLLDDGARPGGRPIIDNLVEAGFDKDLMQVTPDGTVTGLEADSVQFSVRFGDECLIGQSSASGYSSSVGPVVAETRCLLGVTRAIDW